MGVEIWEEKKNSYKSLALSSSFMFNGVVRVLERLCPRICVVRKSNTSKNPGRSLYACPLPKVCLNITSKLVPELFLYQIEDD